VTADEFPGQQPTINLYAPPGFQPHTSVDVTPLLDHTQLTIEKSNILLLGPSGVGKTLMAKTLARVLEVPFSMSDCTPFTQAGYIGEDAEVCVQRLLVAANFDVARAERGIICLDEIDKIATAKVTHGKDVSGEGVQQALLKIIEGTTLQIQSKQDRANAGRGSGGGPGGSHGGGYPSHNSYGSGMSPGQVGGKGDTFTVRTDNILFICTGAFIGLHKVILDRVSKGSIGFGAPVRSFGLSSDSNDTSIKGEDGLFRKHLPYFTPDTDSFLPNASSKHNTLDLVEPADLQKYGMIPELVGRIPISCALSSLDEDALVRVLTEPRNSLLRQYEQLFQLSGIELRLTSGALREVAKTAGNMGTGARGLRTVMERLLGEAMFEAPGNIPSRVLSCGVLTFRVGSAIKHILITESVAQRKQAPIYLPRGQQHTFHRMIAAEEEVWARRQRDKDGSKPESGNDISKEGDGTGGQRFNTFEQYRDKAKVAGFS
jgi:ATP-dependent Clp protease ATP-binding subunit ClpX